MKATILLAGDNKKDTCFVAVMVVAAAVLFQIIEVIYGLGFNI